MSVRSLVMLVVCLVGASVATAAVASPTGERQLVQRVKDPASGLEVQVFAGGTADVSIEVGDRTVQIRKELVHGSAVTTISTSSERLSLSVDPRRTVLDGTLGHAEASTGRADSFGAVRKLLSRSEAVGRAIALLRRLDLGPRSPVGHALLVTRAMLLSETGDPQGAADLARWVKGAQQVVALTPVKLQNGPGDCWKEYTKEAIAAYIELEDCIKNLSWYDFGGEFSCGALYDLRAMGAFSWYLHCVALR